MSTNYHTTIFRLNKKIDNLLIDTILYDCWNFKMLNIVQFYFRVLAQLPAIRSSKLFLAFLFAESNKFTFAYWVLIYLFWIVISKCKGIGEGGSCKNNFKKRLKWMCENKPSLKIHNHFTHRNHTFWNCNEVFSFMRMHELWSIRLGEILFLGGLMR